MSLDPITFEVIRGGLLSLGDEMSAILRRAGGGDLSSGICDRDGRLIAAGQAFVHPFQLGTLPSAIEATLATIHPDTLEPGDMILSNDVFVAGGSHLPDVLLLVPVFHEGERVAFIAGRTHWGDVGGASPGSFEMLRSREIYAEGVRIPPILIARHGIIQEDILRLLTLNMRNPAMRYLDFDRQRGTCMLGVNRITKLIDRYGIHVFLEAMSMCLDYTERRLRAELASFPRRTVRAEDWIEIEGIRTEPLHIVATISVDEGSIAVDLSGCSPQLSDVGFNAPRGPAYAMCLYAIKCVAGSDIPFNQAVERVITVDIPRSTVLNATPPTACGNVTGGAELVARLTEVLIGAFAQIVPDRVPACCGTVGVISLHGVDADPGRRARFGRDEAVSQVLLPFEEHRSGFGARPTLDGVSGSAAHIGNDIMKTAEEIEARAPVRVECFELREGSAGNGRTRGGLGIRRRYLVLDDITLSCMIGHTATAPYGLFGGQAGRPAQVTLTDTNGASRGLGWAESVHLTRGQTVTVESAGGGGYGPPHERSIDRVLQDVERGYYGPDVASAVYGVVMADQGIVDTEGTSRKREELSRENGADLDRGVTGPFATIDPDLRHSWCLPGDED